MSFRDTINSIVEVATAPSAYSVYAGIGVVATTALAIVVTKKYCDRYFEQYKEKEEFEPEPEKPSVVETIKTFAPVVASAALTLYFVGKANSEWIDYNGIINSAASLAELRAAQYQNLASAAVGAELIKGLGKNKAENDLDWYCVKATGNIPDIYFQSKEADILYAMYHTNRNFMLRGTSSVGEFFAFLNIPEEELRAACPTWDEEKDTYGWDSTNFLEGGLVPWIDFRLDHVEPTEESPWIGQIRFVWPPEHSDDGSFLAYGYYPYPTD